MRWLFLARTLAALAVGGGMSSFAYASLTWEKQHLELSVKISEKVAVGTFRFVNSGKTPVTIIAVKPDCGCTTAELTKQSYAAGETGEIKVTFTFENRIGLNRKTVHVTTDEEPDKPVPLVLQVNILEPMTCSPRLLLWRLGDEKSEKTAVISANGTNRITAVEIKTITPPATDTTTRLETVEAGKKYRLLVQPTSLTKAAETKITGVVSFADGTTEDFSVFALVK